MESNNYLLIGSSSELSKKFVEISNNRNFYTVSTKKNTAVNHLGVSDYIDNIDDIIVFVKEIENPTIIFFNGFLAENRPIKIPDIGEIDKTIRFNYFIPLF